MRNFQKAIAVIALSGMCLAAPAPSGGEAPAKKKKHHAVKPAEQKKNCCEVTAEQVRQLKESVDQQAAATQQLQQQLQQTQQQLQQTQQQLTSAQQEAQKASAKAAEVESTSSAQVQKVQSDVSDVKTALNTTTQEVQAEKKKVDYLEHPATIAYKGIRFTPGGFFELTGLYRQRVGATGPAGPATQFNNNALEGTTNAFLSETSMTARGTRLSVRADADAGSTKLAAYFEGDFYCNPFATPNQTTAYCMRIRQGWGRAKFARGWSVTGGQMWNLMTMNRRAADADAPWVPNTVDSNYLVGFNWGRQGELRLAKTFGKSTTFALSIIDPSYLSNINNTNTQVAGLVSPGAGNLANTAVGSPCTSALSTTGTVVTNCVLVDTYSINLAPDVAVKLAFDSTRLGHFEVKGLQRFFRDRVLVAPEHNNTAIGYGAGAGWILSVVPRKVDFVAQGMYGKGVSRYIDGGNTDIVVRTNTATSTNTITSTGGTNDLSPVRSISGVVGFETHPTTNFEFDIWGGTEYYYRTTYKVFPVATPTVASLQGYGAANGANNRKLIEGTVALWYDVYKGSYGTLRYGAQYEYDYRDLWSREKAPKGINNVGMLDMRYILP